MSDTKNLRVRIIDVDLQAWLDAVPEPMPPDPTNPFAEASGIMPLGGGAPIPFSRKFAREVTALVDRNLQSDAVDKCSRRDMVAVLETIVKALRGGPKPKEEEPAPSRWDILGGDSEGER